MNYLWLILSVLFCMVNADWFTDKLKTDYGITCSTPRIRKSYGALKYAEREQFIKMVFQMKQEMGIWKGATSKTGLYNTFTELHANTDQTNIWHYSSVFPFAHKALLWLYESGLVYTGVKNGLLKKEEACSWGIPYWPWELSFDYDKTDSVVPLYSASVFSNPELNGDATPGYVKGYFSRSEWELRTSVCYTSPSDRCDKKLKRKMENLSLLKLDPALIIQATSSEPQFEKFLPWIIGNAHGFMHTFISCSMMQTSNAPDDPMFYMHHGNVDRLFHFWADCHEYDKVDSYSLTPTHYTPIFPSNPHPPQLDNIPKVDTTLEYRVPLYSSGNTQYNYCLTSQFPTVREMWTMGTPNKKGWNGLHYRYGPDALVPFYDSLNVSSKFCKAGNTWTWVNYSPQSSKRSEYTEEMGSPEEMLVYQNLEKKFNDKVYKNGKTPDDALYDLAMESCQSNPQQPIEDNQLKDMIMMGIDPHYYKRICDDAISEEQIEVAMSFK